MSTTTEPADDVQLGEPYCGQCGYRLAGLEDTTRCPECGRPVIEVLMRRGDQVIPGRRYRSEATLFGWPVIAIAQGPAPGETRGHARGIIAIGDVATGMLAMGGVARGVVAIGGVAIGGCAIGGVSVGLLTALGGVALGGLAWGGVAAGGIVSGGCALGWLATGGVAIGQYAAGGMPVGAHTMGMGPTDPEAIAMLGRFEWLFGPTGAMPLRRILQPIIAPIAASTVLGAAIGLLAFISMGRGGRA